MINKCDQCGKCCKLFLINLSETEYKSGKYKLQFENLEIINDFSTASQIGANILQTNPDGSCIYLKDNKCSIHETRPQVCRKFFCNSKQKRFQKMIEQINYA